MARLSFENALQGYARLVRYMLCLTTLNSTQRTLRNVTISGAATCKVGNDIISFDEQWCILQLPMLAPVKLMTVQSCIVRRDFENG
jgi:hypothetical protein